jgi:hypothetical protein
MRVKRLKISSAFLLLMTACSGFPFFGRQSASAPGRKVVENGDARIPPPTVMEIDDIHYDGWTLSARVLVSPKTGSLRLDKRLIPSVDVNIQNVSECEHGSVMSIHADIFPLARSGNLLVLEPGQWYGRTVRFGLFDEHFTGLGPECVEADILLLSFDARRVARQRFRAVRPPRQPLGVPEAPGASADAGFASPPEPQEVQGVDAGWE